MCLSVIETPGGGEGRRVTGLTGLPPLVLLEDVTLFLLRHRFAAVQLPAFVDEVREHLLEVLWGRRLGHLQVAVQPLLGRSIAPPAGKLGREVDLLPLRMVARLEQRGEAGEERLDEICDITVALGSLLEIGDHHTAPTATVPASRWNSSL